MSMSGPVPRGPYHRNFMIWMNMDWAWRAKGQLDGDLNFIVFRAMQTRQRSGL